MAPALTGGRGSQPRSQCAPPGRRRRGRVAPALTGGRGSQLDPAADPLHRRVAPALTGGRGSQPQPRGPTFGRPNEGGARPHGRARIATKDDGPGHGAGGAVAPALTGGRGSQRLHCGGSGRPGHQWRPPSRAGEDRNTISTPGADARPGWRPPSRAGEDRNDLCAGGRLVYRQEWRPPSRAGEDRNIASAGIGAAAGVAPALTGGRGSQQPDPRDADTRGRRGARPHGRARIATGTGPRVAPTRPGGVRPHGRARIATSPAPTWTTSAAVAPALTGGRGSQLVVHGNAVVAVHGWRPPSRAGEDRNSEDAWEDAPPVRLRGAALTGGRGSQPAHVGSAQQATPQVAPALTGGRGSQRA